MANNNKLLCGVAPVALMLAVAPAIQSHAADLPAAPIVAPPAAAPAGFEGFYIGGHRGFGSAEYSGVSNSNTTAVSFDNAGYLFGLHAGYNWLVSPNFYAGVEGDITVMPWNAVHAEDSSAVWGHLSGIASLRGRLGYQMDRALLYATGGVAFAASNAGGGGTINHNKEAEVVVGPVAGAGLEWMVAPNFVIRGEGLYYWFDQKDTHPGETGWAGINNAWALRAGGSWYLGRSADDAMFSPVMMSEAFSGFYVGMHAGYGSADYEGATTSSGGGSRISMDNNGYLVGIHAGRNWKLTPSVVGGVEGDITVAPWDAARHYPSGGELLGAHLSGIASLRGRLGFTFDRTLIYATGGVAFASSTGSVDTSMEFNNSKSAEIVVGPVAGAGAEWMVTPSVGLRAEGLYYWFDQKQSNPDTDGVGGIQNTFLARAGASYYLNAASDAEYQPVKADFQGFYIGGHGGYGNAEYRGAEDSGATVYKFDNRGYLVGAHAGYNWQFGSAAIAGIETDLSLAPWSELEGSDSFGVGGHLSGLASLRGRLGYAFDRSLITVTGGIAFASSNGTADYSIQYNNEAEIEIGPVAGLGFEYMATKNVSLRAEGLYYWFDQKHVSHDTSGFGGIQNTWLARVGASWHFDRH